MIPVQFEFTRDHLIGVCGNLGLGQNELDYLFQLWNEKQDEVKNRIHKLLTKEPKAQNRIVIDHEANRDREKEVCLVGYDPLQELVFLTDTPHSSGYISSACLHEFVIERYEILPWETESSETEEALKDDLPF